MLGYCTFLIIELFFIKMYSTCIKTKSQPKNYSSQKVCTLNQKTHASMIQVRQNHDSSNGHFYFLEFQLWIHDSSQRNE